MQTVRINCTYSDTLPISELTEFQGELKKRSDDSLRKIRKSIDRHGFSFPFFVWKEGGTNWVLDGHGRLEVLKKMEGEGVEIPALPVIYVDCGSRMDAKDLLLRMNSIYGKMTKKSVLEFVSNDFQLDLSEYELPEFSFNFKSPFDSPPNENVHEKPTEERNPPRRELPPMVVESALESEDPMDILKEYKDVHDVELEIGEDDMEVPEGDNGKVDYGDMVEVGGHTIFCGTVNELVNLRMDCSLSQNIYSLDCLLGMSKVVVMVLPLNVSTIRLVGERADIVKGVFGVFDGTETFVVVMFKSKGEIGKEIPERLLTERDSHGDLPIGLVMEVVKSLGVGSILVDGSKSGNALVVAEKLNKKCFVAEPSPENCGTIKKRMEQWLDKKSQVRKDGGEWILN